MIRIPAASRPTTRLIPLILLLGLGLATAAPVRGETIRVAVASNFSEPLAALKPLYEEESGHALVISSGSTGGLYAQISNGAPYHVFLAADARRPARLEQQGIGVAGTRFTYAVGTLVLWSTRAELIPADGRTLLASGDFRSLAMANPRLAPYGLAARQTLASLGLWEALQDSVVLGENIGQTYSLVATGNAQLGFVARSQLLRPGARPGGSRWAVPADLHDPIRQQGILLPDGRDSEAARAFLAFLKSAAARRVIGEFGYSTAPGR